MRTKSSLGVGACGALIALLGLTALAAQAQQPRGGPGPQHYDARYNHNHYYATRGGYVGAVPGRPVIVGGGRYYYSGGVWYAPRGPGFVVVAAPVGMFIPVLPPFYTTVWVAGVPYYYANDTYYMWSPAQSGYEVVQPPGDPAAAATQAPPDAAPSGDLFIYPQANQSPEQQANDKYECHRWASAQSGFDPTQAGGGVPPDQTEARRSDYQRAMRACLEGRGYSVK
jgi:hypothetical protein